MTRWSSRARPIARSGSRARLARCDVRVPVGPQDVGTEVPHDLVLPLAGYDFEFAQQEPDGHDTGNAEHRPRLPGRAAPACPVAVDVPRSLHLEVAVDREFTDAVQQVFAAAHHGLHPLAREVDGRESGNPDVAAVENAARQRGIHRARGSVDGVALGH